MLRWGAPTSSGSLLFICVFFALTFGPNVDVVKCMAGLQQEPDVRVKQQKTEKLGSHVSDVTRRWSSELRTCGCADGFKSVNSLYI